MTDRARALGAQWTNISLEKKLGMFVAPIFVAVITAVLVPRLTGGNNSTAGGNNSTAGPSSEHLEVSDLSVLNSSDGPSIDISVRNTGGLVAVATRAQFRILRFAVLGACLPEAYLLPTHAYDLVLPTLDAQGKTRDVVLHQEIEPNHVDRFTFRVGVDDKQLTSTVSYLYRLEIALLHDQKPTPVRVGKVWLAMPFPQEHWFSVRDDLDASYRKEVESCVRRNRTDLSAIYREPATTSPDLTDFAESVGLKK
jgi:hypothetical protein